MNAHAFNTETHVWVGQQVVNDLLEPGPGYGKLSIPPLGEFSVDADIIEAIENNRKTFLMGNVGPDGFPDIIVGQLTAHPGLENGWKTDDWVAHVLGMGNTSKEIAFKYGYVAHVAADFWAHTYINTYSGGSFDLFSGSVDEKMRHILLEDFIAQHTPPLVDHSGLSLGTAYSNVATGYTLPLESMAETLITDSDVQNEYAKSPATIHMTAANAMGDLVDGYISVANSARSPIDKVLEDVFSEINKIEEEIDQILSNPSLNYGLVCEVKEECEEKCNPILFGLSCKTVCKVVGEVCKEDNTIGALREQLAPLRDYQYALFSAQPEVELVYQALLDWREGIRVAIVEYQNTSSNVAVELMKNDGDPMQEIKDWIACHGLTLTGINTFFVGTTPVTWKAECKIYKTYVEVMNSLDSLLENHGDLLLGVLGNDLYELKNKIEEDIQNRVGEAFLSKIAGDEVLELINAYTDAKNGNIASLMSLQFSYSGNNNLLTIPDIESRVKSEMYISNGYFDPDKYAVAYNSVILAKLVLLNSSELNRMVQESGGHSGAYGQELFQDTYPFNIMLGGVKTIDGDFQWLEKAPPYLRNDGWVYTSVEATGYGSDNGKGFRLFQDSKARDNIFRKIFKGPLIPSIEVPSQVGSTDIKPKGYPYVVCNSNGYPNGEKDRSCALEYLIPAVYLLLK